MGLFDFLKKAELAEIESLKRDIAVLEQDAKADRGLIEELSQKVSLLSRFQTIADAEVEAGRILAEAKQKANQIVEDARKYQNELSQKAEGILTNVLQQEKRASELYEDKRVQAQELCDSVLSNARSEAIAIRKKAFDKLDEAVAQSAAIVKNAENRANEIAGDAYRALNEAEDLSKTVTALRNTIKGYGDEYIIPTYSLLDQLSEDFGYTEAGEELKKARERTRLMLKNDLAAKCDYVEDYRRITAINFTSDAFNGKVDTILSGVKQDNFGTLKQKIVDAYQLVNNLGQAFRNALITREYLNSRIEELKWATIVTELKNREREEQRRIKEQIREEERAKREYEKALKDAEKEEDVIKKALEKATKELEAASDEQKQKYEAKLAELNERLKVAEEKGQRALSMAQQTKSGHVYVISNIGSFGENIYKIGMTRRLEPEDRIKELGDASVPFSFDIHAMIYSEDAPTLETNLHRYFVDNQMNKVNYRKEFFKVGLADVRKKVEELNLPAKWTMTALATEYRESLAIEKELENNGDKKTEWERVQLQQMHTTNDSDDELQID